MKLVFHMDRLAGTDIRILEFFIWWDQHGPFVLTIPPLGGKRTDEASQVALFAKGRTVPGPGVHRGRPLGKTVTNARTLSETPHGRGGAGDAYPAVLGMNGKVIAILDNLADPKTRQKFEEYGSIAKTQFGLEWGGDWESRDCPHVQVPKWRDLPFTPGAANWS